MMSYRIHDGSIQIYSNGKDMTIIMPGQGSYIFKECFPRELMIKQDTDMIETTSLFGNYKSYLRSPVTFTIDLSLTANICESSSDDTPINMTDQYTILELFKIIEKRIDKRSK